MQNHSKEKVVASGKMVYAFLAYIFLHTIFFVSMNETIQAATGLLVCVAFGLLHKRLLGNDLYRYGLYILGIAVLFSNIQILQGSSGLGNSSLIAFGAAFALLGLLATNIVGNHLKIFFAIIAHIHLMVSIDRLDQYIGQALIAPLWIAYAFSILAWSFIRTNRILAKSAFPVIILALIRFMMFDFNRFDGLGRILALIGMGGLIFIGGYIYRKIDDGKNS